MREKIDIAKLDLKEYDPRATGKDELLAELDELASREVGLGFKTVILGVFGMIMCVAVIFPKIYINSNIYYLSLEINTLYSNVKSLEEEQRFLKQKLQGIRYKQDIETSIRLKDN